MNNSYFGDVNGKYCIRADSRLFTKTEVKFADIALTFNKIK